MVVVGLVVLLSLRLVWMGTRAGRILGWPLLVFASYFWTMGSRLVLRDRIDWRIGRTDLEFLVDRRADVALLVIGWVVLLLLAWGLRGRVRRQSMLTAANMTGGQ